MTTDSSGDNSGPATNVVAGPDDQVYSPADIPRAGTYAAESILDERLTGDRFGLRTGAVPYLETWSRRVPVGVVQPSPFPVVFVHPEALISAPSLVWEEHPDVRANIGVLPAYSMLSALRWWDEAFQVRDPDVYVQYTRGGPALTSLGSWARRPLAEMAAGVIKPPPFVGLPIRIYPRPQVIITSLSPSVLRALVSQRLTLGCAFISTQADLGVLLDWLST